MLGFLPINISIKIKRFRRQHAEKHRTLQKHEQTGGSVFPRAMSDSWVAHLLVLFAGDIIRVAIARKRSNSSLQLPSVTRAAL